MACGLPDAKPLIESMVFYCQSDSQEQTSVKLESKYAFLIKEEHSQNAGHFCSDIDELMATMSYSLIWLTCTREKW